MDKNKINRQNSTLDKKRRLIRSKDSSRAEDEFMAAAIGDVEWLKQSLRLNGGEINYDKNGFAPIHLTAIHGRLECLKFLIEKQNTDVNLPSTTGWRPVHLCISNQTGKRAYNCLTYLLTKGADHSAKNDDGLTPAHQAASEGHVQCLKALIECTASIDERDNRGHTPMDLAKLWGHRQCARILAMEVWHQKKEFQAKELQHLQKLRMAEVLREIEIEEKLLFESQGLGRKEIKKSEEQKKDKKQQFYQENQTSLYDAYAHRDQLNSKSGKIAKPNSRTIKQQRKERPPSVRRPNLSSRQSGRSVVTDGSDTGLYERNQASVENQPLDEQNLEDNFDSGKNGFYNPNSWNPSTHIKPKDYITDLADDYPRDEYTKLPRLRDLFRTPAYVSSIREKAEKLGVDVDKLKEELMNEQREKRSERSVVHKPKNIEYSQAKRKYETPFALTSEAPFHLVGDSNSLLVRLNILEERIPPTPSTTLSNLSISHASDPEEIIREQRDRITKSMPRRGQIGY